MLPINNMNTSTLVIEKKRSKKTTRIKGSDAVLQCLIAEGVTTIFGYPGGAIMPIYDALFNYQDKWQFSTRRCLDSSKSNWIPNFSYQDLSETYNNFLYILNFFLYLIQLYYFRNICATL